MKDLAAGKLDADLVQVEADVRDVVREADRLRLTVQAGDHRFSSRSLSVPWPRPRFPPPARTCGSPGVCRVIEATQPTRSFSTRARTFELLLRNLPGDLTVLRRPPWWTTPRLAVAAGTLLGIAVLAFVWAPRCAGRCGGRPRSFAPKWKPSPSPRNASASPANSTIPSSRSSWG
ncbi:MAG: hypothetical protein WDN28_19455 [Chthoniobacter sp.]